MRILVSIKRVPDPEVRVRVKEDGMGIDTEGIKFVINPFDEIAVEEAIRIKEKTGGEVIILSIGTPEAREQIRQALAMGADRGILVKTESGPDPDCVARIIRKIYEEESPDIVVMGKQAVDDDSNQVGQLLAEYIGIPQATFASKIELKDNSAEVTREVDGGLEKIVVELPAVITADLRLNEPRYPSLPQIMKAKQKEIKEVELKELNIDTTAKLRILKYEKPPERKGGAIVPDIPTLVTKLKERKII